MKCRKKVYEVLDINSNYHNRVIEAENEATKKDMDKNSKAATKPREITPPTIESKFVLFFINLMHIKKLLFKYGYGYYWSKWSLERSCETALVLLVKGYTI